MEYRELGRTGEKVSALCLGTMTYGEQNTEAEGHTQMDYALAQGNNFFDAAEIYPVPPKAETQGRTEAVIPKNEQIRREKYHQGDTVRAYITDVQLTTKGPQVILSRAAPELLERLFQLDLRIAPLQFKPVHIFFCKQRVFVAFYGELHRRSGGNAIHPVFIADMVSDEYSLCIGNSASAPERGEGLIFGSSGVETFIGAV